MVEVGDHFRPATDAADVADARDSDDEKRDSDDENGDPLAPGVYRVVGRADDAVALLRVTDADGRRAHTGEVRHVAPATLETEFERAENPDAGFAPVREVRNLLSGTYWSVRRFF